MDENEDDIESEPPVFDTSKEIDYKTKYNQTFEEVISLDNVYILNLDAQKKYYFLPIKFLFKFYYLNDVFTVDNH